VCGTKNTKVVRTLKGLGPKKKGKPTQDTASPSKSGSPEDAPSENRTSEEVPSEVEPFIGSMKVYQGYERTMFPTETALRMGLTGGENLKFAQIEGVERSDPVILIKVASASDVVARKKRPDAETCPIGFASKRVRAIVDLRDRTQYNVYRVKGEDGVFAVNRERGYNLHNAVIEYDPESFMDVGDVPYTGKPSLTTTAGCRMSFFSNLCMTRMGARRGDYALIQKPATGGDPDEVWVTVWKQENVRDAEERTADQLREERGPDNGEGGNEEEQERGATEKETKGVEGDDRAINGEEDRGPEPREIEGDDERAWVESQDMVDYVDVYENAEYLFVREIDEEDTRTQDAGQDGGERTLLYGGDPGRVFEFRFKRPAPVKALYGDEKESEQRKKTRDRAQVDKHREVAGDLVDHVEPISSTPDVAALIGGDTTVGISTPNELAAVVMSVELYRKVKEELRRREITWEDLRASIENDDHDEEKDEASGDRGA